jgi:hypothetical protein
MADNVLRNSSAVEAGGGCETGNTQAKATPRAGEQQSQPEAGTEASKGARQTKQRPEKKPVSARRLAANKLNSGKSTGPKTLLGKSRSRMNSTKHGMLARKTLFSFDGQVKDPELLELYNLVCEENDGDDAFTQFLIQDLLHAYAGYLRGLECEEEIAVKDKWRPVHYEILARYMTRHRNALQQDFKLLRKLKKERTQREEEEQAERELERELEWEREMELAHEDYCDACNINYDLLPPEEVRSDYVPRDFDPWFDEPVEESEPAATPPTMASDHTQPEPLDLPEPAGKQTSDSDNETEEAEPRAEADTPPSDGREPEVGARERAPLNTQPASEPRAGDNQRIPAVNAAGLEDADVVDQGVLAELAALGEASLAGEPEEAMEVAAIDDALAAAYASMVAQLTEEDDGIELAS